MRRSLISFLTSTKNNSTSSGDILNPLVNAAIDIALTPSRRSCSNHLPKIFRSVDFAQELVGHENGSRWTSTNPASIIHCWNLLVQVQSLPSFAAPSISIGHHFPSAVPLIVSSTQCRGSTPSMHSKYPPGWRNSKAFAMTPLGSLKQEKSKRQWIKSKTWL